MRKLLYLSLILAMLFIAVPPVQAQAPAKYETQINVTNVSATAGTITLRFFRQNGSELTPLVRAIQAYETIYFTSFAGVSNFDGSMVIESDVPLASMGMLIGKNSAGSPTGYAAYIGTSAGSSPVYLPLLMKQNYGYSTYFYIQNTSSSAVNATVTYSNGKVTTVNGIQPYASAKIDNRVETGLPKNFSGVVTATGPVAVAVVEYNESAGNQLYSYNGFNTGAKLPVFPIINQNNFGYWTGVALQNMGAVATTVTVSYTPTIAGTACTETISIPANSKRDFGTYAFAFPKAWSPYPVTTNCVYGQRFIGSAAVTANSTNQDLVGIVNQINTSTEPNKGAALMSQNATTASKTVVFPNIQQWVGAWNWWTGMTVINVSGETIAAGDIVCTIKGTGPSGAVNRTLTNPSSLPNGRGWLKQFFQNSSPLPNGFYGGAICTTTSGKAIVGMVNILAHNAGLQIDSLAVYEGINP